MYMGAERDTAQFCAVQYWENWKTIHLNFWRDWTINSSTISFNVELSFHAFESIQCSMSLLNLESTDSWLKQRCWWDVFWDVLQIGVGRAGWEKFSASSRVSKIGNDFYFLLGQSKDLSTFTHKTYPVKRPPQYGKMSWSCGHPGFDRVNFRLGW